MTPDTRRHVAEAAAVLLATGHNWMSNRRIPAPLYIPANVTVAGALLGLGRWGGASWAELGLQRERVTRGAIAAVVVGGLGAVAIESAARSPATSHWFADDRGLKLSRRGAAYEAFVRIPLGTAIAEELTFRGALLGLSLRRRSWPTSIAWTSGLFGLWHVLPTIDTLPLHVMGRAAVDAGKANHAVAGAVVGTAAGGGLLAVLRWATGSVVTPVGVHAILNATALLAARRHHR